MRSDIKEIPKEPPKTVPPLGPKQPRLRRSSKSKTRRLKPEQPSSNSARKLDTNSLQEKPTDREIRTVAPVAHPRPVSVQTPAPPVAKPMPQQAPVRQPQASVPTENNDSVMKAQGMIENLQKLLAMNQQQLSQVMSIVDQVSQMADQAVRAGKQNEEMIARLMEFQQGSRNRAMGNGWRR